ncbi:hypothetical protein LCGC14_1670350 [marine sediment metagenome]|uniref:Uncharacterized protein n=1 Tax=marine sediment metagenome TaxID=412755 RepID=A0A0F9KRD0_9ZZZZ
MYNHTTLYAQAQEFLFDVECEALEAIAYVAGIKVEVHTKAHAVIYWFTDLITGEEFITHNFNSAVDALAYAVN